MILQRKVQFGARTNRHRIFPCINATFYLDNYDLCLVAEKRVKFHGNPFISHFLRKSRIVRHSAKIEFFIILPKHPFQWPNLRKNSFEFKRFTGQRLPLTRALKGIFSLVWWTSINRYQGFHASSKRRFFPCFSSTRRNMSAFKPFCNILLQDDTASCQDYEEYEFVECLSWGNSNYRLTYTL